MVTSLDDMESLASAFIAGANDYITKPVNRIELTARVRAALKLKSELEQRRAREQELLGFVSGWGDRAPPYMSMKRRACLTARRWRPISPPAPAAMARKCFR